MTAYRFWYPTVSVEGIFNGNREIGLADNEKIGYCATSPRQVGFTLNSDTPYAAGALDLSDGPMVIELPPGAYIGLVDDHHQRWVMDMGIPGPDQGKGGKHLVLGPDHDGDVPGRLFTSGARPPTRCWWRCARCRSAAIRTRRLRRCARSGSTRCRPLVLTRSRWRWSRRRERDIDSTCLRWEDNLQFWQMLHGILEAEPVVEEFRPMYGLLSSLGIGRGTPFAPDDRITAILEHAARTGRDQLLVSAFAGTRDDIRAWPDRRWEWAGLVADNADFETSSGLDLEARDRWFSRRSSPPPRCSAASRAAARCTGSARATHTGAYLDGGRDYRLSIPLPVPGSLFWSITIYDAETRSQVRADQDMAALRSLFELRDLPSSGTAELRFGPTTPADGAGRLATDHPRSWVVCLPPHLRTRSAGVRRLLEARGFPGRRLTLASLLTPTCRTLASSQSGGSHLRSQLHGRKRGPASPHREKHFHDALACLGLRGKRSGGEVSLRSNWGSSTRG